MAAVAGNDIDSFIREQKAKLATERQALAAKKSKSASDVEPLRKQQDIRGGKEVQLAIEGPRARSPETGLPLSNRGTLQKQEELGAQRRQEYNQYLAKQGGGDGRREGRQQHDYKQTSMQLSQQRRQEYNDMLAAKEREPKITPRENEIGNPGIIPFTRAEEEREKKRLLEVERHKDYQRMKAKLDQKPQYDRHRTQEEENKGLIAGQHERDRQKEQEQQQYRDILAQQVEEKKRLQLHQMGAVPQPDIAEYQPRLDKDFSRRPPQRERDTTFTVTQQDRYNKERDVPRLRIPSPSQQSQRGAAPPVRYDHNDRDYYKERGAGNERLGRDSERINSDALNERTPEYERYLNTWEKMHGKLQLLDLILGRGGQKAGDESRRKVMNNPQASINVYEEQKRALQEQRRQEMQSYLEQKKEEHRDQSQRRQWKEEDDRDRGGKAIPDSEAVAEASRKKMAEDRKREYLEMKEKSEKKGERRKWDVPENALSEKPLQLGDYERVHQRFQKERQQDYNKMLQSQKPGNRSWNEPKEEKLLPVGENESRRKQLEEQRNREYNEYLKSKDPGNRTWREASAEKPLLAGDYELKRRAIEDTRKSEYQEFLRKTADRNRRRLWKEFSHEKLLLSDEPHVHERERLRAERNRDYNRYLREQSTDRRSLAHQTDEYKANVNFPGLNESDNAKNDAHELEWKRKLFYSKDKDFVDIKPYSIQKERERNEEYNQHLREKGEGRRAQEPIGQSEPEYFATLPGLRDSSAAKRRKEVERNAEYNLHLQSKRLPAKSGDLGGPPTEPRSVWTTPVPTYEDLLDQKRHQEAQYRRANDASFDKPLESERKLAELDKELELKKARFRNERFSSQGVLDDPSWLTPRSKRPSDVEYNDLPRRERRDTSYLASLPVGSDLAEIEKKRQQEQYRNDLQRQIREAADGKRREKTQDLQVNYSGLIDPEVRTFPTAAILSDRRPRQAPTRSYQNVLLDSLDKLDQISPRSEVILGRRRLDEFDHNRGAGGRLGASLSLSRGRGGRSVDTGVESLMDTPRHATLDPPPGLMYQPASYITQGGTGGVGQSSVDEAYSFYATRNPLEEGAVGGGGDGGGGGVVRRNRSDQEVSFGGGGGGGGRGRAGARVRFEEETRIGGGGAFDFRSDEENKRASQLKAQAYQEELNRQMEENRRKKLKDKEDKERYDRKLEQEARDYNPYGRGGGGAPMKDSYGNLITDLRSMHRDNNDLDSPRKPPNPSYLSPRAPSHVRDDLFGPPPVQTTAEGEQSYARGGHGIFGMPKTDSEKIASEKYKSDLMRQIEEKKYEDMKKKEMEREEEAREQRRIEEQQRRMQEEYEEERRRAREKEEEARRKNDELMRLAEERKREAELRKREVEEQRQDEQRREREAEEVHANRVNVTVDEEPEAVTVSLHEVPSNSGTERGNSPPVPAVRTRTEPEQSTSKADHGAPARAQSADVLNQLAAMRKQLQNERQRVETMLENERNEPDVFDPRLVQRPPPAPVVRPEIDVFETARNRNAAPVLRPPAERPNTNIAQDFSSLKFKENSDSRKEFRRLFPDQPYTGDTLEAQQSALLRQQEDNLRRLRDQRQFDSGYPKTSSVNLLPPSRNQSLTPKQLHSDSAFVDVDSINHFPDDFDDFPTSRRNDSARARRRDRRDSSPRVGSRSYADPFGSTTSLNVDRLAKKNEDRLKRLRELQGDDISLYDPDDVLDRFMSKQQHNRKRSQFTHIM